MATKSILIVDDAAETRIFLKGIINSLGFAHFEAKSGIDALKILNDHMIDLVILDVLMPNFDGYQTLEFINKLKQKQDIKVVFLTGKKGELDQAKIDELKPDDLIHKTVEIQVLKTKLKKLLDGSIPPTKPPIASPVASQTQAPIAPPPVSAPTPAAAKPAAPTPAQPAPKPAAPAESKLDLAAKITNMPIELDIKIIKLTQSGITFSAKFQFKEGAQLSIDCQKAAAALKKTGELSVKVLKCTPEADLYIVNTQHT
ncbi:response regulator [Silvanigrella paludirubra]|uniref:Response regulator n=1 Tax=Silvanigrella paludirubra TaxID=2499159 RepID=A0A6N6VWI4_9BACT|nr:response regulator [Silvanigrella paludirubra]KAB8037787.1 response regulator [Silvanigrella paludirubra]